LAGLREILVSSLKDKGYHVMGPTHRGQYSGITSFTSSQSDVAAIHRELDSSGFIVSLREGLGGNQCLRVSPHFYNTDEEINRFLDKLPASG